MRQSSNSLCISPFPNAPTISSFIVPTTFLVLYNSVRDTILPFSFRSFANTFQAFSLLSFLFSSQKALISIFVSAGSLAICMILYWTFACTGLGMCPRLAIFSAYFCAALHASHTLSTNCGDYGSLCIHHYETQIYLVATSPAQ